MDKVVLVLESIDVPHGFRIKEDIQINYTTNRDYRQERLPVPFVGREVDKSYLEQKEKIY